MIPNLSNLSNAFMTNFNNDNPNRIEKLIESNAKAIEALTSDVAANRADIATTNASINSLVETITEFSIRSEARLNQLDEAILEIRNTNQRLENILERLTQK